MRLVANLALTLTVVGLSAAVIQSQDPAPQKPADAAAIALESWHGYLGQIGWPQDMRERIAPRFLGKLASSVANEHGGQTVVFDGSRPGLRATVTLVLGRDGKPVVPPAVELADVLEAQ
ncbi:MAG: hypothetical protein KDC98_04730 [Planctomycetes bacterium]|nr:hypothetical protein [Planctomycetota bacterium]